MTKTPNWPNSVTKSVRWKARPPAIPLIRLHRRIQPPKGRHGPPTGLGKCWAGATQPPAAGNNLNRPGRARLQPARLADIAHDGVSDAARTDSTTLPDALRGPHSATGRWFASLLLAVSLAPAAALANPPRHGPASQPAAPPLTASSSRATPDDKTDRPSSRRPHHRPMDDGPLETLSEFYPEQARHCARCGKETRRSSPAWKER